MDDNWPGRRIVATATVVILETATEGELEIRNERISQPTGQETNSNYHLAYADRRAKKKRNPTDSSVRRRVNVARPLSTFPSRKWDREGHDRINVFGLSRGHCSCHWTTQPLGCDSCLRGNSIRRFASIAGIVAGSH